jgi:hypothetical protein
VDNTQALQPRQNSHEKLSQLILKLQWRSVVEELVGQRTCEEACGLDNISFQTLDPSYILTSKKILKSLVFLMYEKMEPVTKNKYNLLFSLSQILRTILLYLLMIVEHS